MYADAALACLKNALALADAGDLAHTKGRTGFAIALYVLAAEEIAKGQHFRSVAEGLASFDSRDLGKTWVMDPKHLTEHELKHAHFAMAATTPVMMEVLASRQKDIRALSETWETDEPFPNALPEELRRGLEALANAPHEREPELNQMRDLGMRMEALKERGLYVDIRDGVLVTPDRASEEDFDLLKRMFNTVVTYFSDTITSGISPQRSAHHLPAQRRLAARQTRPTGKGFRRADFSKARADGGRKKAGD